MKRIKVFLVDDHKLFRNGLSLLMENEKDIVVTGEAENGKQFCEYLDHEQPDVVLMDIEMPEMDGFEATQTACVRYPDLKVITLTMFGEEHYYLKMIEAGAKGFILKNSDIDEVIKAIKTVFNGGTYFSQEILYNVVKNIQDVKKEIDTSVRLSGREKEILKLICTGNSNIEIASELNISRRTVEKHRSNILNKTNTHNTASLVMYAVENKLIKLQDTEEAK
ncbi:MAG: response regulator transcription factor [Bacteroidales bacterium]|nr:response regulator transcription factor [Bacteroidales bacterium]